MEYGERFILYKLEIKCSGDIIIELVLADMRLFSLLMVRQKFRELYNAWDR